MVALSWDIHTKKGISDVGKYLEQSNGIRNLRVIKYGSLQPKLMDMGGMQWIESGFAFNTKVGSARGIIRLTNVGPTEWKAWTVSSQLEKLVDQDELDASRSREPISSNRFVTGGKSDNEELQVLIIGAGKLSCFFSRPR